MGRGLQPLLRFDDQPGLAWARDGRLIAFGWYGGKFNYLSWLLPLLPSAHHYCEPFGGSAAVLLNRDPSPVETYNDMDGEVVNFFRVLRDQKEALVEAIGLTPFSREEFARACSPSGADLGDLERARRFFVRARQVRTGLAQTAPLERAPDRGAAGRPAVRGLLARTLGRVQQLPETAERLLRVQIENRDPIAVIRLYDAADTLFFCDHPCVYWRRGRQVQTDDDAHRHLSRALQDIKGKAAVSGYRGDVMDSLYGGWRRADGPVRAGRSGRPITGAVWMNY